MLIASVCLIVCLSVTLVNPVKAVGWNELPFGRDTRVVPNNIVLDMGPCPHGKGRFKGWSPHSKFPLQIAAKLLQIVENGYYIDIRLSFPK